MVYYQSMTPLIIKSEHSSQYTMRLCASGQQEHSDVQQHQQQGQHYYCHTELSSQQEQQTIKPAAFNKTQGKRIESAEDPLQCSIIRLDPKCSKQTEDEAMSSLHLHYDAKGESNGSMGQSRCSQSFRNTLLLPITAITSNAAMISSQSPSQSSTSLASLVLPSAPAVVSQKATFAASKLQFKCEKCNMVFGSRSAHASHIKSHIRLINNGITTSGTNSDTNFNATNLELNAIKHQANIASNLNALSNGTDPHRCNVCQKSFAVPARLIRHYRTHTGERPFECEFCHKLFSVKENLQVHRRIHTKERPYKCDICGRAFEHSGKLHRHMRIHTGERPHKCSVCEKTFIQSGQLVIHMRTHTGEKPYKCPVEGCGKGFTCSKQLKVHSRTHTGEKPYHCDICFRDFGYNHVLKLHRVQHYGAKCYKCTICDETFKNKKEMETHIKAHANELTDEEIASAPSTNAVMANLVSSSSVSSASSGIESNSSPNSSPSPAASVLTKAEKRPFQSLSSSSPSDSKSKDAASLDSIFSYNYESDISLPTNALKADNDSTSYAGNIRNNCITISGRHKNIHNTPCATDENSHSQSYYLTATINKDMPTDLSTASVETTTTTQLNRTPYSSHLYSHATSLTANQIHKQALQEENDYCNNAKELCEKQSPTPLETILIKNATNVNPNVDLGVGANYSNSASSNSGSIQDSSNTGFSNMQSDSLNETRLDQIPPSSSMLSKHNIRNPLGSVIDAYDTSVWVQQYKHRNDFNRQSLSKGLSPIPKFESTMENNDIILRQVEAAIAPLHESSDSLAPRETLSPESAKLILMADRDMMTLPLRKRKLYMNDSNRIIASYNGNRLPTSVTTASANNLLSDTTTATSKYDDISVIIKETNQNVRRQNTVIQFAKAST